MSKDSEISQISSIFPNLNLLIKANYFIYALHNKAWTETAVPLVSKIVRSMNPVHTYIKSLISLSKFKLLTNSSLFPSEKGGALCEQR